VRPLYLKIQAIGPYSKSEEIDFSVLGDKRLFLIHGPTGSGKTSILDAMTYALYGDTSGRDRTTEQMRSHWADEEIESLVEFEFAIGGNIYRILRKPKQSLKKRRGDGTREFNAEAKLWRIKENGDREFMVDGFSDVTRAIESLLGFTSEQFRQVIVLPQGKFRDLLSARSDKREEILKILFGTVKYSLIQDKLKELSAEVRRALEDNRLAFDNMLKNEGCDTIEKLILNISSIESDIRTKEMEFLFLKEREKIVSKSYNDAIVLEKKFEELQNAKIAFEKLKAKESDIKNIESRVNILKRVVELKDFYDILTESRLKVESLKKRLEETTAAVSKETSRFEKAQQEKDKISDADKKLETITQEIIQLESAREIITEIQKAESIIEDLESKYSIFTKEEEEIAKKQKDLEKEEQELSDKLRDCEIADARLSETRQKIAIVELAGKKLKDYEDKTKELISKKESLQELKSQKEKLAKQYEEIAIRRSKLEREWLEGYSAVVAKSLVPGKPCPVCGSIDHPSPANELREPPSDAMIESLREEEKVSMEKLSAIERDIAALEGSINEIKPELILNDIPLIYRDKNIDELRATYRETKKTLEELLSILNGKNNLEIKKSATEKSLADIKERASEVENNIKILDRDLSAERRHLEELKKRAPFAVTLQDLENKIKTLKDKKERGLKWKANVEEEYVNAKESLARAKLGFENLTENYNGEVQKSSDKFREFQQRLIIAGISSEKEFEDLLQKIDTIPSMDKEIDQYKQDMAAATERLKRSQFDVNGNSRPDLVSIQKEMEELNKSLEMSISFISSAKSNLERLKKIHTELLKKNKEISDLEERFEVIKDLSDVANGKNIYNITFQRFVLQSIFEEVLEISSGRLERMSRGRYRLITTGKAENRRIGGGLDLEVFDEYTGRSRSVVTLSGGEAFLASLSLAVGLADLVQQRSGGIYLDTVFVDEGFGSLDGETLDLAINTLMDVQSSGRLVGIISHVDELKERIDARLEVIPQSDGSKTKFFV